MRTLKFVFIFGLFLHIQSCHHFDFPIDGILDPYDEDINPHILPEQFDGYELNWHDEFRDQQLDETHWLYRLGPSRESYGIPEVVSLEGGKMQIKAKKRPVNGKDFEGGGILTSQRFKYGYFEVRAKMAGNYGWHEAFWTTLANDLNNLPPGYSTTPRVEIDCFEQYASHGTDKFSYGLIRWYPNKKSIIRENYQSPNLDVSDQYHTWGWEFTPDYFNFYFDREVISTIPVDDFAHNEYHVWLTMIATVPDAADSSEISFDYFRHYDIDFASEKYLARKEKYLTEIYGPVSSNGTDLWIEAENLSVQGGWIQLSEGSIDYLRGHTGTNPDRPIEELSAYSYIDVPETGTYRLWIRSRDYSSGARTYQVEMNDIASSKIFGDHGTEGWEWEDGGTFNLSAGMNKIELFDSGQFYGRCDRMLLTTDQSFVPSKRGGEENVIHSANP